MMVVLKRVEGLERKAIEVRWPLRDYLEMCFGKRTYARNFDDLLGVR